MPGRFPQASNLIEFWNNLCSGQESISFFSKAELAAEGINPELLQDPSYVGAAAALDGIENFDASFFGFHPREAEVLDPQQRLFLECAHEALESAACNPET